MIDGRPLMASTKIRTGRRHFDAGLVEEHRGGEGQRERPHRASPTCSMVPTMAWAPPPALAGLVGSTPVWSLKKKSHRSALRPSMRM